MPSVPGKHQVQQHQVRLRGAEDIQGLPAVGAKDRLEAVIAQNNADHFGQRLVIVHYQNACLHSYIFPYCTCFVLLSGILGMAPAPGPVRGAPGVGGEDNAA